MGAFTTYSSLVQALAAPQQQIQLAKSISITSGTWWNSSWAGIGAPTPGVTPTAGAVCTNVTTGGFRQGNPSPGKELFMAIESMTLGLASGQGAIMICDRLTHMGGLSGTVTTAQTVSLPALTRNTSGVFCIPGVEIYTSIGATGTTFTANYTDEGGTSRVCQPTPIGATGLNAVGRFIPFSLFNGSNGARTVADLTLLTSTATAGNFGVTLIRPLLVMPVRLAQDWAASGDPLRQLGMLLPNIEQNACLTIMTLGPGAVTSSLSGNIKFFEA